MPARPGELHNYYFNTPGAHRISDVLADLIVGNGRCGGRSRSKNPMTDRLRLPNLLASATTVTSFDTRIISAFNCASRISGVSRIQCPGANRPRPGTGDRHAGP